MRRPSVFRGKGVGLSVRGLVFVVILFGLATSAMGLPGNLNPGEDSRVDLTDAIIGLKVLSGISVSEVSAAGDVDADGQIGLPEVIFILQVAVELRPENRPPTATIDSIAPENTTVSGLAQRGEPVTFTGSGTDPDGDDAQLSYRWHSDLMSEDIGTEASFIISNLVAGEHSISLRVTDENGTESIAATASLTVQIQYLAIGDSITEGIGDDDDSDNAPTSEDGGYPPILESKLETEYGVPYQIVNLGSGGKRTIYGVDNIATWLTEYPHAEMVLILFGTNDANKDSTPPPLASGYDLTPDDPDYSGTYKDQMQQILNVIGNAGKKALIGLIPIGLGNNASASYFFLDPNTRERNKDYTIPFDTVIKEELATDFTNPFPEGFSAAIYDEFDFYATFADTIYEDTDSKWKSPLYADPLHPNGEGYRTMADLWFSAITVMAANGG